MHCSIAYMLVVVVVAVGVVGVVEEHGDGLRRGCQVNLLLEIVVHLVDLFRPNFDRQVGKMTKLAS
jgi:hypothetical protein